jgi:hypothetical protein
MSFDKSLKGNWKTFLSEGDKAVEKIMLGLHKRGIRCGKSISTQFGTDEDIPVYDHNNKKIFWISVKTVYGNIENPWKDLPKSYKGWMCGEVESKQWIYPPKIIIWYCLQTNQAWGTITPSRPSKEWIIFPDKHGIVKDIRKSTITKKDEYIYPSYCVPINKIMSKEDTIKQIHELSKYLTPP